jgi:hypothetical protein
LARHWFAAGVPARAIPYYRRGAELAIRVFANEEAIDALTTALDLLGRTPESRERDEEELELRTILGVPLIALGGYEWFTEGHQTPDLMAARKLLERLP